MSSFFPSEARRRPTLPESSRAAFLHCQSLLLLALAWLAMVPTGQAQVRPYIGFVYPAGGQQATTFQVKLGGQGLEDINQVWVSGPGISARVVEYNRVLGNQELTLLGEQLRELKRATSNLASAMMSSGTPMMMDNAMMSSSSQPESKGATGTDTNTGPAQLVARLEKRIGESVNRPASAALASIVYAEVTIAPDAPPGQRELRVGTLRGVSNPLVFFVGQFPEVARKPMTTCPLQVLGKEEQALRKRPISEVEDRLTVPCTANGQIASGEQNRYRFAARKGQRLVITTQARQLIPFIADAVPGWFQPVLVLYDAQGKEVAYDDDYRFRPDPTILYQVPQDGDYVLAIYDAIYRGREDFVYRLSIAESPFITSLFPLGGRTNTTVALQLNGWNLASNKLSAPATDADPGVDSIHATNAGLLSNPMPFARDTLPESLEKEPNDTLARAQKVKLPVILNGRIERPGDWDLFQFTAKSNDTLVAEVSARRLDSPLDSIVKLTDHTGKVLAFNDDCEDLAAGANTHDADSYLLARLPADGTYYIHLGDTARHAGPEYGYRLRLSAPQPDFALRIVPSSASLRSKGSGTVNVHLIRKDGFTGPIKLSLKDPPAGFSSSTISLSGTQTVARLNLKTDLVATKEPVNLTVVGTAKILDRDVTHEAVPAEDRMQAFLWRHMVPASEFKVLVYDPNVQLPPKRVPPARPPAPVQPAPALAQLDVSTNGANKQKFSKQQVAGRLRQLKFLYEEGLLTDTFYDQRVTECEAAR